MKIGDEASFSKTITEYDVYNFAGITGDFNSVHVNKVAALKSRFGKQVCHGMLIASFISTVLGMYCPGTGTILLEQDLAFKKPVYIGDTITARVRIINIEGKIVKLDTIVTNQEGIIVVDGKAKVLVEEE